MGYECLSTEGNSTVSLGSTIVQAAIRHQNRILYSALDKIGFARSVLGSLPRNIAFRKDNPTFAVPPLSLLWDAQSYTDYFKYKTSGEEAATLYWQLIKRYMPQNVGKPPRVCEWGCGPGRIIRHLPVLGNAHCEYYGTDYNHASIEWCARSIRGVTFQTNRLAPPLAFPDGFFDVLFCRSVFTHLSEQMHYAWIRELSRVVKPAGVFMISTQGFAHRERLLEDEKRRFDQGELVVRHLAAEGKLNFSAFHHPQFVRDRLLQGFAILEHQEGRGTQDLWIVKNTAPPTNSRA